MFFNRTVQFVRTDLWRIRSRDLGKRRSVYIRALRILVLTIRGLAQDRIQLQASALTYYSALSVVPALAMVFGIAKGFGFETRLRQELMEKIEGQQEVVLRIVDFSNRILENVRGGLMAVIGLVFLFYTIIKVLSHIESAFNNIWGVKTPRTMVRKITDYISMTIIAPFMFLAASTFTVILTGRLEGVIQSVDLLGALNPFILFIFKLLPYWVLWLLFTFLYMFMPNTRVRFGSAALAGVIAGTVYQVFQWGYIKFQIGVASYNAIYGSFAALPLFFIWLQLSWLIVLFGAEISFAHQNVNTFEYEPDCLTVSSAFKRLLSVRIVHLLIRRFMDGRLDLTEDRISQELEIPITLVRQLVFELVSAGLVSEVTLRNSPEAVYQPARDTDRLTIKSVIEALEQNGTSDVPVAQSPELLTIAESMQAFGDLIEHDPANKRLKDI
ncbi:MAG: YihY/virulence factor BrkB family protein [Proteobacteria bacterium]|nr:YihY/virulence factor BrkB family protein [Pseudomonadota bacterium]